jgi:hypothetical protein
MRVRDLWWLTGARGDKHKTPAIPIRAATRARSAGSRSGLGDGTEASKAFAAKVAAEKYAAAQDTDIDRRHYTSPKDARITVGQWCEV